MKKTIKQTTALTLAVIIASSAIGTTSFAEEAKKQVPTVKVERLAGKNRYETSVKISKDYATVGGKVIVASGENYADALSGSPLSGEIDAPILLTSAKETPAVVKKEINRINPSKTYVLGGTSSVSETQLNNLPNSQRVAGKDRIETSIKVNELRKENTTLEKESIYNAFNYPDALSAGPLARAMKLQLIPVQKANNPSYIFGGKSTVKYNGAVEKRFSGKDRYVTSVEIAKQFAEINGGVKKVVIASGEDYPDALSSSIVSKAENAPILLVRSNTLPQEVRNFMRENKVEEAVVIGGTSSVTEKVVSELKSIYASEEIEKLIEEIKKQIETKMKEKEENEKALKDIKSKLDQAEKSIANSNKELEELKKDLKGKGHNDISLLEEYLDLQFAIYIKEDKIKETKANIEKYEKEIKKLKEEQEELEKKLEKNADNVELKEKIKENKSKLKELEKSLEFYPTFKKTLEEDLAELKMEEKEFSKKLPVGELKEELEKLKKIKGDLFDYTIERDKYKNEVTDLEEKIAKLDKEIKELENKIKE